MAPQQRRILALDVGSRSTGAAFMDRSQGIPLPLETIAHAEFHDLVEQVSALVEARDVDTIVLGLPLLPSGQEGEQCTLVRSVAAQLHARGLRVALFDERYTTPRIAGGDVHAKAAATILSTYVERLQKFEGSV